MIYKVREKILNLKYNIMDEFKLGQVVFVCNKVVKLNLKNSKLL